MASGRERRRKGLVNRVRRVLYGVMLWMGAQAAVASQGADAGAHPQQSPSVAARSVAMVQLHSPSALAELRHTDFIVPSSAIPLPGQPLIADYGSTRLVALDVDSTVLGALRDGVAVKFAVGDFGGLRLNLYKRKNARTAGQQVELNPANDDAPVQHQFWSLGGSLDLVRTAAGAREVVFTPQMVLDFDALTGEHHNFQAFVQYAAWKPGAGRTSDEKVPQVAVKLRF